MLESGISELGTSGRVWAEKENEHRKARAKAFIHSAGKNRETREAVADPFFEKERLEAFLAEVEKDTCLEKVRSLRTQMSALQTIIAARRSEMEATAYNQIGHNQS
jgi:hypothetical protein